MSWKSIFIKEDDVEEKVVTTKPAPVVPTTPQYAPSIAVKLSDTDYNKYLSDKMKENNQPGPDYLEFSEALKALDNVPLSEEQKYQVTFPTYLSMGVDANKLINSANGYIKILEQEEKDFNTELNNTKHNEITIKQSNIEELKAENDKLTKKLQDNALKIQALTLETNKSNESLSVEQNAFAAALNNAKLKIQDQITKIKTYLDGTTK
jgi:SMC interacting uncharacterized protein involved in chromosome segregation